MKVHRCSEVQKYEQLLLAEIRDFQENFQWRRGNIF